jgi:Tfp pilus assembly protein PilN
MIEINLLPGAKKSKKGGGGGLSGLKLGPALSGLGGSLKDPFLFIAVGGLAIGLAGTGYQHLSLQSRDGALTARVQTAEQDSTRYAAILKERAAVEAQRDSMDRQLAIIRAIDGDRYVWPHLLDEISEALPPYTWLTQIGQTTPVPSIALRDSLSVPGAEPPPAGPGVRIVGQTVDIQALTRYMRLLEASPFIDGVTLVRSDITNVENREVTEFTLDLRYQVPDSAAIRTVPLTVAVR